MPLYEYRCLEDGELIEMLRPMADADKPVPDPAGKGRTFARVLSTFSVAGSPVAAAHKHSGPGCACGNPHGPCGRQS
jgi:putative FmdB family regulatory protein